MNAMGSDGSSVWLSRILLFLSSLFLAFQFWILFFPEPPLITRSTHIILALVITLVSVDVTKSKQGYVHVVLNCIAIACTLLIAFYYWESYTRLSGRIIGISPIEWYDVVVSVALTILLVEAVRRVVGWVLTAVVIAFIAYGLFGYLIPGTWGFRTIDILEWSEDLTMTTTGVLGLTTASSVNFIFYFIVFGAAYSAVGGGQLFIDLAGRIVGSSKGGGAKIAVVSSSLMGTISGSAVANVSTTGVFTIPLMKSSGVSGTRAAAIEAISSTGGQLIPPVMGIAAFVMADLLAVPYVTIAIAGIIPALLFYFSLFVIVHLDSCRKDIGTIPADALANIESIWPRIHMLSPIIVLIAILALGYSAQMAAAAATACCMLAPLLRRNTRYSISKIPHIITDAGKQAAVLAVPIITVGIVITVAVQSNLALKFAAGVISFGGDSVLLSLVLVVVGCIIMGMGLPTVAAYIIGAVLFVPAVKELGISPLQAHFFVMYFCVLSMITPPVALASFTAAGIAKENVLSTSVMVTFIASSVFLIPFAFVQDNALLFQGPALEIATACIMVAVSVGIWAIGISGYFLTPIRWPGRVFVLICSGVSIFMLGTEFVWPLLTVAAFIYLLIETLYTKRRGALLQQL